MANEVPCRIEPLGQGPTAGYRLTWGPMRSGDVGAWQEWPHFPNKSVSVEGAVRAMRLEGRNHAGPGAVHALTDADGLPISRPGLYRIALNPWQFRPVVDAGDSVLVTAVVTN